MPKWVSNALTSIYAIAAGLLPLLVDQHVIGQNVAADIGVALAAFAGAVHLPIAAVTNGTSVTPTVAPKHEA